MTEISKCPCIFGNENCPDAGIICNFAGASCSQAYGETVSCSRDLSEILQRYITQKDFVISNICTDGNPGYNLYVFDNRHDHDFSSAQPLKVRFDSRPAVPAATNLNGYAHFLTNKLMSVTSDAN